MAELLLELLSEEIPARMQARAADDLKRLVCVGLLDAGLEFESAKAYVTPRHLALVVAGLPEKQKDIKEEKKGPKVGSPEQALAGFMKGNGLSDISEAEVRTLDKGDFYFAVVEKKGEETAAVLPGLLEKALLALPWPKSMRWGTGNLAWVRPIHGLTCVFDGKPVAFDFGGVLAGASTVGHRFLSPDAFEVKDFADYQKKLTAAKVMLDPAERRQLIKAEADKLAAAEGLTVKDDPGLLDEVTGLVEWPVVLMGSIDDAFMDVPPEVLTTAMRSHQKYFSCLDADGKLAPRFIVVANTETQDGGKAVTAGNERVLRARLSDAKFFWDQDRKQSLASRAPALSDVVFHAKLGNLDEKVDRMQALAADLAGSVPDADKDQVRSAARLAKADLTTGMVGEFASLQGVMGRYYALHDDESAEVAEAIADHYSPQGPGDQCPTAPVSVAVALADKIDTLVGFWAIDERPTGSKDPFALRRAALGVIRLIIENNLRLSLYEVFGKAYDLFPEAYQGKALVATKWNVASDLVSFFGDRLEVHLKGKGTRHDLIAAVFSLKGENDLVRVLARVSALSGFLDTEDGANLLTAFKRAANILRIEEKKDGRDYVGDADPAAFSQAEEKTLFETLASVKDTATAAIDNEAFEQAMAALATLRGPVDAFFDEVTVNADEPDLRENRLKLLSHIRSVMGDIADFSKIEGSTEGT